MQHYFVTADALREYKVTRNGLLGPNYSSKLSAWLAAGCVSPRSVAAEVRAYEARVVANDSTYWLLFELLWRDYFRLAPLGWGRSLFLLGGPRGVHDPSRLWRRPRPFQQSTPNSFQRRWHPWPGWYPCCSPLRETKSRSA